MSPNLTPVPVQRRQFLHPSVTIYSQRICWGGNLWVGRVTAHSERVAWNGPYTGAGPTKTVSASLGNHMFAENLLGGNLWVGRVMAHSERVAWNGPSGERHPSSFQIAPTIRLESVTQLLRHGSGNAPASNKILFALRLLQ